MRTPQEEIDYLRGQLARADKRIDELNDELDRASERILRLEELVQGPGSTRAVYAAVFGLTPAESFLFSLLVLRERVSREQIENCMYPNRPEPVHEKLVYVLVHRIRKKILPKGIMVGLVWGGSYCLSPAMKELVVQRVKEWDEAGQPIKHAYRTRYQDFKPRDVVGEECLSSQVGSSSSVTRRDTAS